MSGTLELKLSTANAAFDPEGDGDSTARNGEVARILRELADKIESESIGYNFTRNVLDINGNAVGTVRFKV